jgi:hypothetical protein
MIEWKGTAVSRLSEPSQHSVTTLQCSNYKSLTRLFAQTYKLIHENGDQALRVVDAAFSI